MYGHNSRAPAGTGLSNPFFFPLLWRITGALALLFAVAALLVAPMPAQAQTTIWSAELTVGYGTGEYVYYGYYHPSFNTSKRRGALTSNTFTVNSSTFRVFQVQTSNNPNGRLLFRIERTSGNRGLDGNAYRLTVDGKPFFIGNPKPGKRGFHFNFSGLRWRTGDKIAVKLEVLPALSGATLTNLTLRVRGDTVFSSSGYVKYPMLGLLQQDPNFIPTSLRTLSSLGIPPQAILNRRGRR